MRRLKTKAKPAALRGRQKSRWSRRLVATCALGAVALGLLGGIGWLSASGWFGRQAERLADSFYVQTVDAGFAVEDVLVQGRQRTARGEVLTALQVERGVAILAFDPRIAKERLEALPWVLRAEVERRLPRLVYVRLVEREPLAIWQLDGKLAVIDQTGAVIAKAEVEEFAHLPLVVGQDAPLYARDFLQILVSEPKLNERVVAAVRVGARRWNVRLDGGIDVQLPAAEPAEAWAQLARIERQQSVLESDVVVIDLRLPDRLIVRSLDKGEKSESLPEGGEET